MAGFGNRRLRLPYPQSLVPGHLRFLAAPAGVVRFVAPNVAGACPGSHLIATGLTAMALHPLRPKGLR